MAEITRESMRYSNGGPPAIVSISHETVAGRLLRVEINNRSDHTATLDITWPGGSRSITAAPGQEVSRPVIGVVLLEVLEGLALPGLRMQCRWE